MERSRLIATLVLASVVCTAIVAIVAPSHFTSITTSFGSGFLSDKALESADGIVTNLFSVNLNRDLWGYGMNNGPNLWKAMFPRGSMPVGGCNGNFQSPIRVRSNGPETIVDNVHPVEFNYPSVSKWVMTRTKNRLFMQRHPAMGMGVMSYRGRSYKVRRVELHKPAQHSINGVIHDMELVIVHNSDDGRMANVAIPFAANAKKEFLHNLEVNSHLNFHNLPENDGDSVKLQDMFSLSFLLNKNNFTYFAYTGSQDEPPCIEGVQWIVMAAPQWMNNGDLELYPQSLVGNARVLQPLRGRKVYMGNKATGNGLSYNRGMNGGHHSHDQFG